ncbi:MAG: YCF48-related protein [Pirellulaceae bacterium]
MALSCPYGQAQINTATPATIAQSSSLELRQAKGTIQQKIAQKSRGDAALRDIVALNADRLCAVGDCGTILVTNNAGRTWEAKDSKTELDLYAVQFADSQNGIAVGGGLGNYSGISRAVILRTTDGGASWESIENNLPCLRGLAQSVRPTAGGRLVAWGDFDPRRNSGVFISQDRGQSWTSSTTPLSRTRAAALLDPAANGLFVVDDERRSGQLDLLNPAESRVALPAPTQPQTDSPRSKPESQIATEQLQFVHHTGRQLLACGRRGLLKRSQAGATWGDVELPLSEPARQMCSLKRITQRGPNVWICGSPGSLLFHSPDFGETWRTVHTNETLPLNKIVFLDERRGWAIGSFGRILATRDGGRSWYRQRGISRTGMLCTASNARSVPWETLAANAWEAQSATVALIDPEFDSRSTIPATLEQRTRDASSRFGVHLEEQGTRTAKSSSSIASLRVKLATWNPDIVISPPVQANVLLTMLESKTQAGNGILKELGLPTPSIQKVLTPSNREMAHCQESKSRVLNRIELSGLDLLLPLPPSLLAATEPSYFRTVWSASNNSASRSSVHGGVASNPASSRNFLKDGLGNYPLVMGRASRSQLVGEIIGSHQDESTWTRDLDFVISQLPVDEQAPALWRLYNAFSSIDSNWKRQAVLNRMIASRTYSDAKVWAMMTLLRTAASDEVQGVIRKSQANVRSKTTLQSSVVVAGGQPTVLATTPWNASPFDRGPDPGPSTSGETEGNPLPARAPSTGAVTPASGTIAAATSSSAAKLYASQKQTLQWFEMYGTYSKFEPRLLGVPALRMLEHRLSRADPTVSDRPPSFAAKTRLKGLVQLPTLSNWREAAIHELYFEQKMYEKTQRLGLASFAPAPPRLDGSLNEKAWEQATRLPLSLSERDTGAGENPRSERQPTDVSLRCMHDDTYVYLGIECTKSAWLLPALSENRQYDAVLEKLDHVQVCFDTNRDYATGFEFSIAADGETSDQCHDFVDFNPKWYVQVAQHPDQSWTAEVAILRSSAFGEVQQPGIDGQVWAVSAARFTQGQLRSSTNRNAIHNHSDAISSPTLKERPYYILFEPSPPSTSASPDQPALLPENPPHRISSTKQPSSR